MKRRIPSSIIALLLALPLIIACNEDDSSSPNGQPPAIERSGSLVRVSAKGKQFVMGSATGNADEKPAHNVAFSKDFWMDSTEVTQGEYDRLLSLHYPEYIAPGWGLPYGLGDNYPVYLVEWGDAVLYCNARSSEQGLQLVYSYSAITGTPGNGCKLEDVTADMTRNGYRLPTEAEWEYACRGGVASDFSWGKNYTTYPISSADSVEFGSYAVWAGNSWYLSSDFPDFGMFPVASKKPNAYGLYDMHGNLWEWCHDWYGETWYAGSPSTDPVGPDSGAWHSLRGGSWGNDATHLRCSNREFVTPDYLFNFIGFRTVRNAQ